MKKCKIWDSHNGEVIDVGLLRCKLLYTLRTLYTTGLQSGVCVMIHDNVRIDL